MKQKQLFISTLIFFVGLIIGYVVRYTQSTLDVEGDPNSKDFVLAKIDGAPFYQHQVWTEIQDQVLELEKNIYQIKKEAVLKSILTDIEKSISASYESESENFNPSDPSFQSYLKEKKIQIPWQKLTEQQKRDLSGNFLISQRRSKIKEQVRGKLGSLTIEWAIPTRHWTKVSNLPTPHRNLLIQNPKSKKKALTFFGNFHCPYCLQALDKAKSLMDHGHALDFRYILPTEQSEESDAFLTGLALYCVQELQPSALTDYFNKLQALKTHPNYELLLQTAASLSLHSSKFEACLKADHPKSQFKQDLQDSAKIVPDHNTPYFLKDKSLVPAQDPSVSE